MKNSIDKARRGSEITLKKCSCQRPKAARVGETGFILMTSYMLLTVLSVASLAIFSRGNSFLQATERNQSKIVAFNMAEAGVDMALAQLELDPLYAGSGGYASLATTTVSGGYEVTVTTPTEAPNTRLIQAVGHAPFNDPAQRAYERREITVYAEFEEASMFNFAVFADDGIDMGGNAQVDSYDSRNGPYGGANAAANGDVGTNSTGSGTVGLTGNVVINGDVEVGTGGVPENVVETTGNAEVNGNLSAAPSPHVYEAPTTNETSLGGLSIQGNTNYQLPAGTYRFSSLSITGNGQLTPLGPVTIYVDGAVKIAGNGVATQQNLPTNFLLMVTGSEEVKVAGNGNFYGGIYAPNSHVKNTGNGEVFGAIVSNTYQQTGNGNIHYDEALSEVGGNTPEGVNVKSWRESNTTAWL